MPVEKTVFSRESANIHYLCSQTVPNTSVVFVGPIGARISRLNSDTVYTVSVLSMYTLPFLLSLISLPTVWSGKVTKNEDCSTLVS